MFWLICVRPVARTLVPQLVAEYDDIQLTIAAGMRLMLQGIALVVSFLVMAAWASWADVGYYALGAGFGVLIVTLNVWECYRDTMRATMRKLTS